MSLPLNTATLGRNVCSFSSRMAEPSLISRRVRSALPFVGRATMFVKPMPKFSSCNTTHTSQWALLAPTEFGYSGRY